MSLVMALQNPDRKERIIADCVALIDREVASKSGFSGAALKAGYAAFKKIRPGIARAAVTRLLPEMAVALDRHWQTAGAEPGKYFRSNATAIADDLLKVTDAIAARSDNRVLVKLYSSLRPSARDHVATAVPSIPDVIHTHLV